MNILEDVINQIKILTDSQKKFVYHSEWLMTTALTQTYSYIIENGLKHSKLVTGESDVFLQVKEVSHICFIIISRNPTLKPKRKAKSASYFVALQ